MKIPSLTKLYEEAMETLQRFPFVILASMLGAFIMIYVIDIEAGSKDYQFLYNTVMCCGLGISFLLSLTMRNEIFKLEPIKNYITQGIGVLFLIAYYFWLPKDLSVVDITRFILFALGFHFLVSFTAFMSKDAEHQQNIDAFWRFNKLFFLRILTSVLFSGVLYAGLCVAILSFNELFNAHINGKIYPQLFFFILGVFNTWFFLAGIPENLNSFYEEEIYPKSLKIFTQFVLLPLVTTYLVILYMYMGKIIIQWNLPVGWVSYLILCFSIAGIFSLLLIYPIRNYEENKWIKVFSKSFYIALLPLIVLLFIAILTRLFAYGITEKRYFVFVLAFWLSFIALYFLISNTKNIKIIPITLCLLCFATSFGPWGAFSVSQRSQMNRLEKILTENKILQKEKIVVVVDKYIPRDDGVPSPIPEIRSNISDSVVGNISSVMDFLAERNEMSSIQKWFDVKLDTIITKSRFEQSTAVMKLMGLKYKSYYRESNPGEQFNRYFNCDFEKSKIIDLKGFNYLIPVSIINKNINADTSVISLQDSDRIKFQIEENSCIMKIILNNKEIADFDFGRFIGNLGDIDNYTKFPVEQGIIRIENEKIKFQLNLENLYGDIKNGTPIVNSLRGDAFIKLK